MKKNTNIKRTLIIFLGLVLLTAGRSLAQQNAFTYTQYADNLTPLNSAYSVVDKAGSISLLGRKQFVGIQGAPTTFLFNGNFPLENINSAVGLSVLNDQFAVEHQTEINAYFAKAIQLEANGYLAVSLNAGIRNYSANFSSLDPSDPSFRDDVRQTKPNLGFGVMYFTDTYYIGLSVPELTITNLGTASVQDANNFKNHYYFSAALITKVSEDILFKPATLVSYSKGVPVVADISGTFYLKDQFGIGANYRTNNQLAGIITVNLSTFRVGYSYQFGTGSNNFGGFNNATHEVTLSYRFGKGAATAKTL
ncbi:type IX secretion system membrane protein PorP/SprF [soil metagenome]|jgi:type IX secretion system PorP/SprF family membrane protein